MRLDTVKGQTSVLALGTHLNDIETDVKLADLSLVRIAGQALEISGRGRYAAALYFGGCIVYALPSPRKDHSCQIDLKFTAI